MKFPALVDVVATVREIANESPGFVYEVPEGGKCSYARGDSADCIVGRAMAKCGVPLDEMRVWDSGRRNGIITVVEDKWPESEHVAPELLWLSKVQDSQDDGNHWSEAVKRADAWVYGWDVYGQDDA